jgi:hypothetical protein
MFARANDVAPFSHEIFLIIEIKFAKNCRSFLRINRLDEIPGKPSQEQILYLWPVSFFQGFTDRSV